MTNEKSLAERFNEILTEMNQLVNKCSGNEWYRLTKDGKKVFVDNMGQKIAELEHLGIEKAKLEEAIGRILKKVEEEVRKILESSTLTETEKRITNIIDDMKRSLAEWQNPNKNVSVAFSWGHSGHISELKYLQVSEQDLIQAKERVLRVVEQLVKAAEKLE